MQKEMRTMRRMFRIMRKSKGFTLIELLIVIAIIGILAAIAIPSLMGAKDRARNSGVDANTDSIFTMLSTYDTDSPVTQSVGVGGQWTANAVCVTALPCASMAPPNIKSIPNPFDNINYQINAGKVPDIFTVTEVAVPKAAPVTGVVGGVNWGQMYADLDSTVGTMVVYGIQKDLSASPVVGKYSTIKTNR